MRQTIALLATVLLTISCGQATVEPGASAPDRDASTLHGTWELIEGEGPDGDITVPSGTRITLLISEESFGGTACNSYGSQNFSIEGSDLSVIGLASTDMACDSPLMDAEQVYLGALIAADTIERNDDELILSGEKTRLRYSFVPPPETADLVGTTWVLESLVSGGSNEDGVASSMTPAELLLREDGTLSGTTGCRPIEGRWIENGDEIRYPEFSAEGGCPSEMSEQDGAIVSMGDGYTFTIEGDVLTIDPRLGDTNLVYRAKS